MSSTFSFGSVSAVIFPGDFQGLPSSRDLISPPSFIQLTLFFCAIFQGFVFQSSGRFTTTDPVSSAAKVPHAVIALLAFSNRWLLTPHQSFIKPPAPELQSTFHATTNNQTAWKRTFPPFSPFLLMVKVHGT